MKGLNNRGFTLIETLAAVTILSLVFIPIHFLFIHALQLNQEAKQTMVANQLAQQHMETTKYAGPFENHEIDIEKIENDLNISIGIDPLEGFSLDMYQITVIVKEHDKNMITLRTWVAIKE